MSVNADECGDDADEGGDDAEDDGADDEEEEDGVDEPMNETELAIAAATSCVCVPDEPVAVAAAATGMNSSGVCTPRVRLTDAGVAVAAALVSSDISAADACGAESAAAEDDTDDLRLDLFAGSRRRVSSTPTMAMSEDCVSAVSPLALVS
jgi:hypothetical protein